MTRESSVITGVGIVSAIGTGQAEFFESLLQARCGFRSLSERTDGEATPGEGDAIDGVWIGAPVTDFQPKLYVKPRKALKVMCREIQTAFASAHLAVEHAGLAESIPAADDGLVKPERLAAVYGSEVFYNPPQELEDSTKACLDEDGKFHAGQFGDSARRELMPLWMLKYLPNMPACQVGISLNSQGPNNTLVLGDVSGPASLLEGMSYLDRDLADVVLVGATGTRIGATRMIYHRDSPAPQRGDMALQDVSRPHDPASSGVVGGEGAASIVLESESYARDRGATVLAKVKSVVSRFSPTPAFKVDKRSAERLADPSREAPTAITLAIKEALRQADINADQLGLVVSHAMGDPQADAGEAKALEECGIKCPVLAVGGSVGHTGAAAGMMGVAAGTLALANKTVPPSVHPDANPAITFCDAAQPLQSANVLCLSFTTEGSAMAVILGES